MILCLAGHFAWLSFAIADPAEIAQVHGQAHLSKQSGQKGRPFAILNQVNSLALAKWSLVQISVP